MSAWLDDDEMAAWRGMVEVRAQIDTELEADLMGKHGITLGEYAVLGVLSEVPDLAARLHLSPSGLTRRLDRLVGQGLVARRPSDEDRRATLAVLTPAGRSRLEAAAPDHVRGVRRAFLDHLSRTDITALAAAFEAVRRARSEQVDPAGVLS
jgi:DNA-binding MarR family transcriptional regulator